MSEDDTHPVLKIENLAHIFGVKSSMLRCKRKDSPELWFKLLFILVPSVEAKTNPDLVFPQTSLESVSGTKHTWDGAVLKKVTSAPTPQLFITEWNHGWKTTSVPLMRGLRCSNFGCMRVLFHGLIHSWLLLLVGPGNQTQVVILGSCFYPPSHLTNPWWNSFCCPRLVRGLHVASHILKRVST